MVFYFIITLQLDKIALKGYIYYEHMLIINRGFI